MKRHDKERAEAIATDATILRGVGKPRMSEMSQNEFVQAIPTCFDLLHCVSVSYLEIIKKQDESLAFQKAGAEERS
jgi:hypothetical protein